MNREDIIRMAREACDPDTVDAWKNGYWTITQEELERFAALVAAAEREALVHLAEGMDFGDGLVAIDDLVTALKQRGEA
jgi:hypothetical protein